MLVVLSLSSLEELYRRYTTGVINKDQMIASLGRLTVSVDDVEMVKDLIKNAPKEHQDLAQQFLQDVRLKFAMDNDTDSEAELLPEDELQISHSENALSRYFVSNPDTK